MRALLPLVALLAASPALAGTAVLPSLSISPTRAGDTLTAAVTGAEPNATVFLVLGVGGTGPGVCPAVFQGDCFDVVGPYRILATGTADASGFLILDLPIPATVPPGTYAVQVAANGTSWTLGEVDLMSVAYACPDDGLGDNDAFSRSLLYTAPITDGVVCEGARGQDFFEIVVPDQEQLELVVSFDHANDGDIDLVQYESQGFVIGESATVDDTEELGLLNLSGGPISTFVEVDVFDDRNTDGVLYDLVATSAPLPDPCQDDAYEPNDDIPSATTGLAIDTLYDATSCDYGDALVEDDDYYAFDLVAGGTYTFEAFFSDDDADIDLEILDALGSQIDRSTSVNDDESLTYTSPTDQTVYLNVFMWEDGLFGMPNGAAYSFRVSTGVP